MQEVERQYKDGTVKAAMVAVLKAVQPAALTVQGELVWPNAALSTLRHLSCFSPSSRACCCMRCCLVPTALLASWAAPECVLPFYSPLLQASLRRARRWG